MSFGFSIGGSDSKSTTEPWKPQGNLLKNFLYPEIQSLYQRGPYDGPYTAPIHGYQTMGAEQGAGLNPLGYDVASLYGNFGRAMAPALGTAGNFYDTTLRDGTGYTNPLAGGLDMNLVNQVASNPFLDSQIDAALRDPYRQFSEQVMPGIALDAIGSGNAGSSRRAITEGLATRGFMDRATDTAATMRGAAYDQGLNAALQSAVFGQQGQLTDIAARQDAAGQLTGLGQLGMGYAADEYTMGQGVARDTSGWGDYLQGLDQQQIMGMMSQYMQPWELLQMASSMIQGGNWGGSTKSSGANFGLTGSIEEWPAFKG